MEVRVGVLIVANTRDSANGHVLSFLKPWAPPSDFFFSIYGLGLIVTRHQVCRVFVPTSCHARESGEGNKEILNVRTRRFAPPAASAAHYALTRTNITKRG